MNTIVWRDDDLSKDTDLKKFKEIHHLFMKYNVIHTITLICKDIDKATALVKYMKYSQNIDIQVHAWQHYDMTIEPGRLIKDIPQCVRMIQKVFGKTPTMLYPPWNKTNFAVERIAHDSGLRVSANKISLSQYLRGVKGDVINFHFWADECKDLEPALKQYKNSK